MKRTTAVKAATATAAVAAIVAAAVLAASVGIQQAVQEGSSAQSIEAALGANDVAAKAVVQALLIAEEREFGLADDELVTSATHEARTALAELVADVERIGDRDGLMPTAHALLDRGEAVIAAAETADVVTAARLLQDKTVPMFELMRDALVAEREAVMASLEVQGSVAGLAGVGAAFLVALVVPGAFVYAYRSLSRRQVHFAQVELDARLAAEQEIARSKDEFIANISHELRTPLTSIYGFSEVLLEEGMLDLDTGRDLVAMINRETTELGRMVEDLLVTAGYSERGITYVPEPSSPVEEVAQVVGPLAWHGNDIVADMDDVPVFVDRLRFRQVVRNLVSNGLKHGAPPVFVVGWATPEHDIYTVVVSDHGDGIPDELLDRVFQRFVHEGTTPLTAGSVGLGLAVANVLAEGMGGSLEYRRVQDRTAFVLRIPLANVIAEAITS